MVFRQRKAKLYNGQIVRAGDEVSFVNSDGKTCVGEIKYDINNDPKKLYFWNVSHEIVDYHNAKKVKRI